MSDVPLACLTNPFLFKSPKQLASAHPLLCHQRRKKNNKISGTLSSGNGGLICVERVINLYLGGCAIHMFVSDVLPHIENQCNINAECEALRCSSRVFKAFKITV